MGEHFRRRGVDTVGTELQKQGVAKHTHWGAFGLAGILMERANLWNTERPANTNSCEVGLFSSEGLLDLTALSIQAGVQTDLGPPVRPALLSISSDPAVDHTFDTLSPTDLVSIIKASQVISAELAISSMLEAYTELVFEASGADSAVVVLRSDDGTYLIATERGPNASTVLHEQEFPLELHSSPLLRNVVTHASVQHPSSRSRTDMPMVTQDLLVRVGRPRQRPDRPEVFVLLRHRRDGQVGREHSLRLQGLRSRGRLSYLKPIQRVR